MRPERIPIFPLEAVLFPGVPLPLHIFEPRYREMTRRCLDSKEEFGVILQNEQGIAAMGCTAQIVQVLKKYDDGRMDILTVGRSVFRVEEVLQEKEYYEARVAYLEDQTGTVNPARQSELLETFEKCHKLIFGQPPPLTDANAALSLAFHVASELPLDLDFKQELLTIRAEAERQLTLLERLKEWAPQLAQLNNVKKKAAGNGHGLS